MSLISEVACLSQSWTDLSELNVISGPSIQGVLLMEGKMGFINYGSYSVKLPFEIELSNGQLMTIAGSMLDGGVDARLHDRGVPAIGRNWKNNAVVVERFQSVRISPKTKLGKFLIENGVEDLEKFKYPNVQLGIYVDPEDPIFRPRFESLWEVFQEGALPSYGEYVGHLRFRAWIDAPVVALPGRNKVFHWSGQDFLASGADGTLYQIMKNSVREVAIGKGLEIMLVDGKVRAVFV